MSHVTMDLLSSPAVLVWGRDKTVIVLRLKLSGNDFAGLDLVSSSCPGVQEAQKRLSDEEGMTKYQKTPSMGEKSLRQSVSESK